MVTDVCVVGEALTDVVAAPTGIVEHPGGSPANVALGLARLGVRVAFLTSLGADDRGARIAAHLEASGVRLVRPPAPGTRTASATVTTDAAGAARYEFDIEWALPDVRLPSARAVHTGSIASFLPPGASRVRELLTRLGPETLVTYDPNVRPALVGDRAAAVTSFEAMVALADVVKLSDEDAGWLYPSTTDDDVVARLLGLGAGLVVITRGADGSTLATPRHRLEVPSAPATVVDTIGAGDTYMASLVRSLLGLDPASLSKADLGEVGRTAAVAAAVTVSRAGADLPTAAEVRRAAAGSVNG